MGLKLLHSADWHLDSPLASFREPQRQELSRALASVPERIGELIRREGCDLALLAGDLFDGRASKETVETLKAALKSWEIPVFIAPGNHDPVTADSPWAEEWPENVYIFRGGLECVSLPGLNCRIWGAGYQSMDCPPLLEHFRAEGEGCQIAVLHGDPVSPSSPCCPITAAQVEGSGLHYLALGHIHAGDHMTRGRTLCAWPGCPMGRGWDETGKKGVFVAELEERAAVRFVSLNLPEFQEQTLEVRGDALELLKGKLPTGGSRNFYRITLEGEWDGDAQELSGELENYPNLILRDRTTAPVDLWANAGEDSLEGALFSNLYSRFQSAQGREQAQVELSAKICRKLLEGREVKL